MRYLIIGFSTAAVSAIKSIRKVDPKNEIVVFSEEDRLYSRPLISYYLAGKIKDDNLNFVDEKFEEQYNVKVFYSTKVISVDVKNKVVKTEKNEIVKYDKLLICSGSVPIIPQIKGIRDNIEGIFTFTKLNDAKNLLKYIYENKIKNAVILGGGLIGIKVAEGLLARGIKFKIVDIAERLLSNTFDETASKYLEEKLEENGCQFVKCNTIVELGIKNKKLVYVKLEDGSKITTNLLIIAVGVRPNVDFIKDSGIKINKGILVDEYMLSLIHI